MSYEENKISDLIDKGLHEQEQLFLSDVIKRFCSCGKELEKFETGEKCYECLKIEWTELKSKYGL